MKIEITFPYDEAAIAIRRAVVPDAEWIGYDRVWLMTKAELVAFSDAVAASADVGAETKESVAITRCLADRATFAIADFVATVQEKTGEARFKAVSIDPQPGPGGKAMGLKLRSGRSAMPMLGTYSDECATFTEAGEALGMTADAEAIIAAVDAIIEQRHGTMIIISRDLRMTEADAAETATDAGMRVIRSKADDRGAVRVVVAGIVEREHIRAAFPTGTNSQLTTIRNAIL